MKFSIFLLLVIFLYSCSDSEKQEVRKEPVSQPTTKADDTVKFISNDTLFEKVQVKEMPAKSETSEELEDKLDDVFSHYIKIKDELADNDSIASKQHALELLESITETSTDLNKVIDTRWKLTEGKYNSYRKMIESSNTLKKQRELFNKLSASMLEAIQKYGLPGKTIYEMESEGSLDGKSGVWVVDSKSSENPYSGDEDDNRRNVRVVRGWEFE